MSEVYFKNPGLGGRRVVMRGFKLDDVTVHDVTVHEGQCLNKEGTKELNEKGYVTVKFEYGKKEE